MLHHVCLAVLVAACGSTDDDRPATLANITQTILKPSCATAECHSSFKMEDSYAFDTVEVARRTFQGDATLSDLGAIGGDTPQTLILNLTIEQENAPRMPYDAPIPNADIDLIQKWLDLGLPGICGGKDAACQGSRLVPCSGDAYDISAAATVCANGCLDGACQ